MLFVLLLVIIAFVLWLKFRPSRLPQPPQKLTAFVDKETANVSSTSRKWFDKTNSSLFHRGQDQAKQFKNWANQTSLENTAQFAGDAQGFVAWLNGLSEQQLTAFVQHVAAFCKSMGFDLNWLMNPRTVGGLKRALEEPVALYVLAAWKARDVESLAIYHAWQQAPNKRENRLFAQRLYMNLVKDGLVAMDAELLAHSDKERRKRIVAAVQQAAIDNQPGFIAAVKKTADESAERKAKNKKQEAKSEKQETAAAPQAVAVVATS